MFKKAVDAKSHQRLSGADRKKLRRTIRDRFSNASDALLDLILPPKVPFFSSIFCYIIPQFKLFSFLLIELHWTKYHLSYSLELLNFILVYWWDHTGGVSCFKISKSGTRLWLGGRLSHVLWRRWARSWYFPYRYHISYLFPTIFGLFDNLITRLLPILNL